MPELPEVETIVRGLRDCLQDRVFSGIDIGWSNSIQTDQEELKQTLPGKRIISLTRRGKYLVFSLSGSWFLILHLKMSGKLIFHQQYEEPHPHVRTQFHFEDGSILHFHDIRKFGRVYFVKSPETVLGNLGPEPLSEMFTVEAFRSLIKSRRGRLKPLLLNQHFIAGLGNIYTDESCFSAHIHPVRSVDTLKPSEIKRLHRAIQNVLLCGIKNNGASLDEIYQGGSFQNHFCVYGRKNEPCVTCATPIERIILAGRSTHFCPSCQK